MHTCNTQNTSFIHSVRANVNSSLFSWTLTRLFIISHLMRRFSVFLSHIFCVCHRNRHTIFHIFMRTVCWRDHFIRIFYYVTLLFVCFLPLDMTSSFYCSMTKKMYRYISFPQTHQLHSSLHAGWWLRWMNCVCMCVCVGEKRERETFVSTNVIKTISRWMFDIKAI